MRLLLARAPRSGPTFPLAELSFRNPSQQSSNFSCLPRNEMSVTSSWLRWLRITTPRNAWVKAIHFRSASPGSPEPTAIAYLCASRTRLGLSWKSSTFQACMATYSGCSLLHGPNAITPTSMDMTRWNSYSTKLPFSTGCQNDPRSSEIQNRCQLSSLLRLRLCHHHPPRRDAPWLGGRAADAAEALEGCGQAVAVEEVGAVP